MSRVQVCPREAYEAALGGMPCEVLNHGRSTSLPVERWLGPANPADGRLLLAHCVGQTLDVGCGPGRLTAALVEGGVMAMGIDVSPAAVQSALQRGATALCRDVFGVVPGAGRWHHLLLADGNVGIGGDPVRLLRRSGELVRRGGTVVVELAAPGIGVRRERLRLRVRGRISSPFDWAYVGADAADALACAAGLEVVAVDGVDGRWVAVLRRPLLEHRQVLA